MDSHDEIGKGSIDFKKVFEYISQLDDKTTILIEISDYNKALNSIKYLKENGFME
jgi:L-ribulose-5-phosphate 3-epimerase UlaE